VTSRQCPGYRVLREIARGAMGRVFAAYDLGLDRDVQRLSRNYVPTSVAFSHRQ
jgi:hypothetical protein